MRLFATCIILCQIFWTNTIAQNALILQNLRVEYQKNPLGIGESIPRFSWQMASSLRAVTQKNYQLWVAADDKFSKKSLVWDSQITATEASHLVEYRGPKLLSRQRYFWKVTITDNYGNTATSDVQYFEMGIVAADWVAQWIEPEQTLDPKQQLPCPQVRKEFVTTKSKIASARLYVTSRGLHEVEINGNRVGDAVLAPGWTAYQRLIQYHTYDVTSMLTAGKNAIGATLADGWYRGGLTWDIRRNIYGDKLALLAQLVIKFTDGSEQIISTDNTWKATTSGPTRKADLYMGEVYDARQALAGWSSVGFDDKDWWNVKLGEYPKDNLVPVLVPVKKIEEIKPTRIFKTPAGETVIDFGQNLVGWVKFKVRGKAGDKVLIHHAEVLDKAKNFYTANLRQAKCELEYTLKDTTEATFEPRFTFMGFQFIRLTQWVGEPQLDDFVAVVVHSDMETAGDFKTSKPVINQLQHNIVWGQKGNFLDVPTDCPQRDERLGWTGDAQAFARTATFNKNVAGFFTKWLRDVAFDQKANGAVPFVVPDVLRNDTPSSGWSDVATIAPWTMYQVYDDKRLLANQYESMKKWVGYMRAQADDKNLWMTGFHFGDWLSYRGSDSPSGGESLTDNDFIASAFYAHSTKLLSQAALALGKAVEAVEYAELNEKIKAAFNREFVSPSGRLVCNTQTAYVLALHFDLLPENLREQAVQKLVGNIKSHQYHLTTGFLGTPYLCEVLSRFGQTDVAYNLLNQETYPSWLYPVKMGATTIWERWDGIKPDGSFQDVGMNSFNHYAYGAIGDWMYQRMAGLNLLKPGYKEISIKPEIGGSFTSASASYDCPYGTITSAWELAGGKTKVSVVIPPNTKAQVVLPNAKEGQVTESGKALSNGNGIKIGSVVKTSVALELGSGSYVFEY